MYVHRNSGINLHVYTFWPHGPAGIFWANLTPFSPQAINRGGVVFDLAYTMVAAGGSAGSRGKELITQRPYNSSYNSSFK
jgi:hypothetical protein